MSLSDTETENRHWEDVDFEALTEKFDKAAEKGKPEAAVG